jgi:hypothetical protein
MTSPTQGELLVTAQDGSYLTMTISDGDVAVAVDTDNDGTIDGNFVMAWDEMN